MVRRNVEARLSRRRGDRESRFKYVCWATADAVDDWVYTEVANTFVLDESMLERLRGLNPHSAHALVQRLLEANGRGYWDADSNALEKLREISRSLEDQLEGVA